MNRKLLYILIILIIIIVFYKFYYERIQILGVYKSNYFNEFLDIRNNNTYYHYKDNDTQYGTWNIKMNSRINFEDWVYFDSTIGQLLHTKNNKINFNTYKSGKCIIFNEDLDDYNFCKVK